MITSEKGYIAEENALNYLKKVNLKLLTRNYYCCHGEIDLIMLDEEQLVFVEVRLRTSTKYGGGVESITHNKKQKILKTATYYTLTHREHNKRNMRFDVVSIDGKSACITWLKDAFGSDY